MQLASETLNTWAAIRELEIALPIAALQNVIKRRETSHKKRAVRQRQLVLLRAAQLQQECAA